MALQTFLKTFRAPAATGVQTLSGFGFQPKAILAFHNASAVPEFPNFPSNASMGVGVATDSSAQFAGCFFALSGADPTDSSRRFSAKATEAVDNAGNLIFSADVSTLWSDGVNLNYTTTTASYVVHLLGIGGTDITNVVVGVFSLNTATGTQTVVGLGFQPDVVFLLAAGTTNGLRASSLGMAKLSWGVAKSATERWALTINARDAQTMTGFVNAVKHQRADSVLLGLTDNANADYQINHTSMLADGFSVNVIDAPASAYEVAYLALKGGSYGVGVFEKSTNAAPTSQAVTVGFSASAVVMASFKTTSTTAITADLEMAYGVADFATAGAAWVTQVDALIPTVADKMLVGSTTAFQVGSGGGNTWMAAASLTGRVASGFNLTWAVNNAAVGAIQIGYFAVGDAVAAAGGQTFTRSASDGVYMLDAMVKGVDRNLMDRLFVAIPPAPVRTTEAVRHDDVLVSDAAFAQAVRQRVVLDAVYVNDARLSSLDRAIMDAVFVADAVIKGIDRLRTDLLLVVDIATVDKITGGGPQEFSVLITDGLYLLDRLLKIEEHTVQDSVLLADLTIRQMVKQLLASDTLLLRDDRTAERTLTVQDQLLLTDLAQKIRDLLISEGMYVTDSATATYTEAIVQLLIYARLQTRHLLGAVGTHIGDWLGQRTGVNDWMGIVTRIVKPPTVH